jgi:hypothetical protein
MVDRKTSLITFFFTNNREGDGMQKDWVGIV